MVVATVNVLARIVVGAPNIRGHAGNLLLAVLLFLLSRLRLWRVRNRLLVSYFFFGVVPLVLVVVLVSITATTLFGLIAADRVRRALDDRVALAAATAREVATVASHRLDLDMPLLSRLVTNSRERAPGARALLLAGGGALRYIPDDGGPLQAIPSWSMPGEAGLFESGGSYFVGAHASAGEPAAEVFAYAPLADEGLATLTRDVAVLSLVPLTDDTNVNVSMNPNGSRVSIEESGDRTPVEYSEVTGLPPKRGFWDPALGWSVKRPARRESGETGDVLLTFVSRPSLLMPRLADPSDLGPTILIAVALFLGGLFFLVIVGSVIWSARLTRTITRSVHDLYEGTRQVAAGNLAHRTPVTGKDQLSELATSFNGMTERVQELIVEVGEKKKLESELEIARNVQLQQFPKSVPKLATLEVAALCIPSRFVSGDYYDYVSLTSGRLALALGDVSGKGISAALVMASLQSALHAQLRHAGGDASANASLSTATLMGQLSEQLYENTPAEKYATFFCSTYDDRTGNLLYTNAGHLPPILIRGNQTIRLDVGGTVVGLMPIFSYDQQTVELQPGDLLAMFTDGVTEAEDASGEQFGDERLARLLMEHKDKPLEEIVKIVADRVRAWAHDPDNADDTTILLARRL
jgi:sigma-B regulation protein RsbU (phosphoserine phosphatase)